MDEQQLPQAVQQMQNNNAVQLKLIEYMQADIAAKDARIRELEAQVERASENAD